LVANIVEKDLKQIQAGDMTRVEVDAFPGEMFSGRIARLAPVLDPATRTAPIEVEIANPGYKLKPGMYARVTVTTDERKDALVVPTNAVVDYTGRRGVFVASGDSTVSFRPVRIGIEESEQIEILDGVADGDRVVTIGAAGLRDGDRVLLAGASGGRRGDGEGAVSEGRGSRESASSERRGSAAGLGETGPRTSGTDGISADRQFDSGTPGQGTGRRGFGGRRGQPAGTAP
jgi:hypothetical protein